MNLIELEELWNRFKHRPFPEGYAGKEIRGVCLVLLDTMSAGCLDVFYGQKPSVSRKPRLDRERLNILKGCHEDLHKVIPFLKDEILDYFKDLNALIDGALKNAKIA